MIERWPTGRVGLTVADRSIRAPEGVEHVVNGRRATVAVVAALRSYVVTGAGEEAHTYLVHLLATTFADIRARLLAEHVPDHRGRCRACTTPGYGTPNAPWPCILAALAMQAEKLAESWGAPR